MSDAVRVGVLGCSSVAWRRTLPALVSGPSTRVVAVASRNRAKALRFADAFQCAATTYDELLARDDVDAIYAPLPTALHAEWGVRVLRAGKHLLVEKPAAADADEARELGRVAAEQRLILRENFTFLHHPQHQRVRQLVAAGRLGEIRSVSAAFCFPPLPDLDIRYAPVLGGGALLDAGVYPLRLAQLLLGDDLEVAGAVLRHDAHRNVDVGGRALLVSGTGVTVDVQFGFEHAYGSSYALWGSKARLDLDRAFTPASGWQPVLHIEEQDHVSDQVLPAADQFALCIASFAEAIRAGRDASDATESAAWCRTVRTLELVDQVRRSAEVAGARQLDRCIAG